MGSARPGRRPSKEEELLLLLCGTSAQRTLRAGRIRALARLVSTERFLEVAVGQRLTALALHRLEEVCTRGLPPTLAQESSLARERDRPLALAFEAAGEHVLDALAAAGLPALALKGAPLARALYRDPALRPSSDIDVLVRREELSAAIATARTLGYGPPVGAVGRGGLPALHFVLAHREGLPTLELHWRIHWLEEDFSRRVLERSVRRGERLWPRPVDEIAMLLLFFARDGFAGLRLAADLAACMDRHEDELWWLALEPLVTEHPQLRAAWTAAAGAAQALVGVPAWRLIDGVGSARRVGLAIRLANWTLSGDIDQAAANVSVVDGLLTPRRGLCAFARRDLLPSRVTFAHDNPVSAPSGHARAAWWLHPIKRLLRYALALWSVRRGRYYAPLAASSEAGSEQAASPSG